MTEEYPGACTRHQNSSKEDLMTIAVSPGWAASAGQHRLLSLIRNTLCRPFLVELLKDQGKEVLCLRKSYEEFLKVHFRLGGRR